MTVGDSAKPLRSDRASDESAWDLPGLVAALRDARNGSGERRSETRSGERPSRDALVEIVKNLRAVLFPTHFGVTEFTETSIDYFVGSTLDTSLRALQEQVRRCLLYAARGEALPAHRLGDAARVIVAEFAATLPRIRTLLELDIRAAYDGDPAATSRTEVLFCYPGITAIMHHRIAHELYRLGVPLLARIVSESAHANTGIDIHPGAQIGESFFIDHGTGVVIGETAVIGDRVCVYQGVTLGARSFPLDGQGSAIKGAERHPIIEDDVVLCAEATILGRITIGRGSTIGGNVWLTHSVPPGSIVTQARSHETDLLHRQSVEKR